MTSLAAAVPAGDEYLPNVPKAAGKEVVANPDQGAGASVLEPGIRGASSSESTSSEAPVTPATSSDDGNSSSGTLLNPVILLVIAGVIAAASGMALRRGRSEGALRVEGEGTGRPAGPRPTPDGEIVTGGDEAA